MTLNFNPQKVALLTIECPYCGHEMDIPVNEPFFTVFGCQADDTKCAQPFIISIQIIVGKEHTALVKCLKIESMEGPAALSDSRVFIPGTHEDFPEESPVLMEKET